MSLYDLGRKLAAWELAGIIPGWDPLLWRIDCDSRIIYWPAYGDRDSDYGWELDHVPANAFAVPGIAQYLRARHWRGNASHGGIIGALLNNV